MGKNNKQKIGKAQEKPKKNQKKQEKTVESLHPSFQVPVFSVSFLLRAVGAEAAAVLELEASAAAGFLVWLLS